MEDSEDSDVDEDDAMPELLMPMPVAQHLSLEPTRPFSTGPSGATT